MSRYQIKIQTSESIHVIDSDVLSEELKDYVLRIADELNEKGLEVEIVLSQAELN